MSYLLSDECRGILEHFAWSNGAVVLDYDGTLAPLGDEPNQARMRPETRRLLDELCLLYPVAVLSGRALNDVLQMLDGASVHCVVGNHGAEWSDLHTVDHGLARRLDGWRLALRDHLSSLPGVMIEDKRLSLTIHYRQAPDGIAAERAIRKAIAPLAGVRVLGGNRVINLIPEGAPHKGVALERLLSMLACEVALYAGDDDTDEDVFALERRDRVLAVRVGASAESKASYFLRGQDEIDALLATLVELRRGGSLRPGLRQALRGRS